jgi:hypothetical protein
MASLKGVEAAREKAWRLDARLLSEMEIEYLI